MKKNVSGFPLKLGRVNVMAYAVTSVWGILLVVCRRKASKAGGKEDGLLTLSGGES